MLQLYRYYPSSNTSFDMVRWRQWNLHSLSHTTHMENPIVAHLRSASRRLPWQPHHVVAVGANGGGSSCIIKDESACTVHSFHFKEAARIMHPQRI